MDEPTQLPDPLDILRKALPIHAITRVRRGGWSAWPLWLGYDCRIYATTAQGLVDALIEVGYAKRGWDSLGTTSTTRLRAVA
jgi:hypothetical protein